MITINESMLPISAARCGKKLRAFSGITIHETANKAASATAKNHMVYMTRNGGSTKQCSYHYVADETEVYHLIPDNEVAWHAGDGANGKGNNETIAIEICVNAGANFEQTCKNAAYLAAALLHERKIKTVSGYIFEHHDFSSYKKNCPAQLRAGQCGGMAWLRQKAQQYLDEMWNVGTVSAQPVPAPSSKLYRVQAGAFSSEQSAKAYAAKLSAQGIQCFVTDVEV